MFEAEGNNQFSLTASGEDMFWVQFAQKHFVVGAVCMGMVR